jgi:ribosomal protein L6P/L9E
MTETQTGKQSRNGKKPIEITQGVIVTVSGKDVTVKGPKGELTHTLRPEAPERRGSSTKASRARS